MRTSSGCGDSSANFPDVRIAMYSHKKTKKNRKSVIDGGTTEKHKQYRMTRGAKHTKKQNYPTLRERNGLRRVFSRLFTRQEAEESQGIPDMAGSFGDLGSFLDGYEIKSRKSLGRSYRLQAVIGRLFRFVDFPSWRKLVSMFRTFCFRSSIIFLIGVIVYSVTPGVLSAPKSVSVSTRAEWEEGTYDDISTTAETDAIRLRASGTWTARVWAPSPDNISFGSTSALVDNHLYVMRGYGDKAFYRYDVEENSWDIIDDLPQPAHYGSDMVYDGDGGIYAIFGGYSRDFYRYDIEDETWEELPELLDTVYQGASIAFDGTDLYITRGQASTDFWKYDISEGSWYNLAPSSSTLYRGSNAVYGEDGYLYVLRGYNGRNLYRYDIAGNSWDSMTNAPNSFYGETKGVYYDGYIYFLRSNNTSSFYRYDIAGNSWDTLDDTPANANYASLTYNADDGYIYAVRGNGQYHLWKFDPDAGTTGEWVGPENLPATVNTGGDLIWNETTGAGAYLYGVRGGNNFYRYDISANDWTSMANPPASLSYDTKGTYYDGYIYIPRGSNSTLFYRYDISGNSWSTLAAAPANMRYGANAVYLPDDGYIYVNRGNGTNDFYRYDISGDSWTQMADSVTASGEDYDVYYGGRLETDGTYVYLMPGDGETAFLRYDPDTDSWDSMARTPFAQYYGTDMTYRDGRFYALAGYYKDETWAYDVATDEWYELPANQEYTFGRGPYNGASIEYAGGDSFYATPGFGLSDMWSFTLGSGNYPSSGTYVSETLDLSYVEGWTSFTATDETPSNTSITYETRTSDDGENFSDWEEVSGSDIVSPENRYLQVRITLATSDGESTPTVYDFEVAYESEDGPPSNPTGTNAYSTEVGGELLVSGVGYKHAHPYFSWEGASDAGSGIAGYYVYFGTDTGADPETDGIYQEENDYTVSLAMETGDYVLRIRAVDGDGNVAGATYDAFTYSYAGVSPYQTETRTTEEDFEAGTLENASAQADGSVRLESVDGFWKESRLSYGPSGFRYGAELAYVETEGKLYTFRGNNAAYFYSYEPETDTWETLTNAPANVHYGGYLVPGPEGYLYGARGYNTSSFWRYDIDADEWDTMASAPKNFNYGSSLSFDGERYIYALPGNDDAFYRYDTQNNIWTTLTNAEFGNPNEGDGQRTYRGSDSVYDGTNAVYVLQGNYYPYFSKYAIDDDAERNEEADTWTPLAESPIGVYSGGSLAYDADESAIYMLSGNYRQNFFKYEIDGDSWEQLPEIPAYAEYGASLSVVDGYVYATRGAGSTAFYRFNIDENSWETPSSGFFGPTTNTSGTYLQFYYGAETADDGQGGVYVIRGYRDNVFGRFDTDSGEFTELPNVPVGTYNGAAMAYVDDEDAIYLTPGDMRMRVSGENNYFLKYDVSENEWEMITADPVPVQTGYGSSMIYDGDRYLYLTRGSNSNNWWRYDTQGTEGSRWSAALPTISGWTSGYGGRIIYRDGYIYSTRGQNTASFFRYDTDAGTWEQLSNTPSNIYIGGSLADGGDGYLYTTRGNNTDDYFRYEIATDTWETLDEAPAQIYRGGSSTVAGSRFWTTSGDGTNSYRDGLYSYVVGSEANGTGFEKYGSYTSESVDLVSVYRWANLTVSFTEPDNTDLAIYTRTSEDEAEWSAWDRVANERDLGDGSYRYDIVSPAAEYIQVKSEFTSSDRIYSPSISEYSINYYQDLDAPTNPSAISAYEDDTETTGITTDTWYAHEAPYFSWPDEDAAGGATDGEGGSGIVGYWVYFGTESDADPFVSGSYQTVTTYEAAGLTSGEAYYLRIQAVDDAGMIPATSYAAFTYRYDATPPTNPTDISVVPAGYTSVDDYEFLWEADAADASSGIAKFQYRTGGDETDTWVDIDDPETVTVSLPNAEHVDGAYQSGKNWFYLRAVDAAGNVSSALQQEYYYSADAPSPPENLAVTPEYSTTNNFSFSWDLPASFVGDPTKLVYYYSINALPNEYNTVETTLRAAGPGPFATQKGTNRFYVVAKDEAGAIDYDLYAYVDFTADTTAPGPPTNVQIFDTSDRENQEYSIAIKWTAPASVDEDNFSGYTIFRSLTETGSYEEVATTTGSAYVDTGLESQAYYYYVKSKDNTNNLSIASSTVDIIPTGRYTTPPTLTQEPSVETKSFSASFSWGTNRVASSFVEYGTSMSLGKTNGQVDSVTDHVVDVSGLSADTKYYYRAKYIDPDGNIGTSEIGTFTTLPPPTVSEFTISDITLESAYVLWDTNASATCTLKYGPGSYSNTVEETAASTGHVEKVTGLVAETSYQVQVDCLDADLNDFSSDQYTFSTPVRPVSSEVTVENMDNVDLPTVVVEYLTNVPTTTLVTFLHTEESTPHTYLDSEKATEHRAEIAGLDPAKEYTLVIGGTDENGIDLEPVEQKITTRSDSRPPEILENRAVGRTIGSGDTASANIYVKIETNETTNVKVHYAKGVTVSNFEQSTAEVGPNTYHLITIPAEVDQMYSYQIEATDEAGNTTTTKAATVVVERSRESASQIIIGTTSRQFGWLSSIWR
jgi:hypothetical protein